eukprot:CAMPEP_0182481088 /NCGR_PEP_ID=MMETSP1319-20130603/36781_1 /TAXON_ID=172717 /ORGANISM="Bolidomonas pacifica, Strain RCC208" /LENGTH=106 /DNA_ID=CAMNT_0024682675 /DNA_START=75 /DNA_END=392 /DNA_ORIENTATION=-
MAILFTYFLVLSGLIYDLINEPPSIGSVVDPATGRQKPQAVMPYRINGQYIIEGLSGGFMYCVGGIGFVLLDLANRRNVPKKTRYMMLIGGAVFVIGAYNMCLVFL